MKKTSIGLLILFLLSLAALLWLQWRVESLEAEQDLLYQKLYHQQIDASFDFSRTSEIYAELHGRHGLYWHRNRAAVSAGASAFVLFCVNVERLKRWLYRK